MKPSPSYFGHVTELFGETACAIVVNQQTGELFYACFESDDLAHAGITLHDHFHCSRDESGQLKLAPLSQSKLIAQ